MTKKKTKKPAAKKASAKKTAKKPAVKTKKAVAKKKPVVKKSPVNKKTPVAKKPAVKKAVLKTQRTAVSPADFIRKTVTGEAQRDSMVILEMMQRITGDTPRMWGSSIIGYGDVHLKYASGRELDWFKIGFSPRKANITLYVLTDSAEQHAYLKNLGKYSTGKGCLYIKSLADVDVKALENVIRAGVNKKGDLRV